MLPTWIDLLGIHGTFLMYATVCLGIAIFSFFFMPETSGMSLEEIEEMYRPKNRIVAIINAASVGIRTADPLDESSLS